MVVDKHDFFIETGEVCVLCYKAVLQSDQLVNDWLKDDFLVEFQLVVERDESPIYLAFTNSFDTAFTCVEGIGATAPVGFSVIPFVFEASTAMSALEFAFQSFVFGDSVCGFGSSFLTKGLSRFKGGSVDDGRMAFLYLVGIYLTIVLHSLEGECFGSVGFSVHLIPNVFLVLEDIEYASS